MEWLSNLIQGLIQLLIKEFKRIFPIPPIRTLRVAHANRGLSCSWSMGKQQDKDIMIVVGDFLITNLTNDTVFLSHSLINKKKRIRGTVGAGGLDGKRPSTGYLMPKEVVECRATILIQPPVRKAKEVYIDDVAIVDNFGNEHWFKHCHFDYFG